MIRKDQKLWAISGAATSGKDTLYRCLNTLLTTQGKLSTRIAFADFLKFELKEFILKEFGINVFEATPEQKELIRPILLEYGYAKRQLSEGQYLISKVEEYIKRINSNPKLPKISHFILTDLRYAEYDKDEDFWVKAHGDQGKIIFLERFDLEPETKKLHPILPANDLEEENLPKIKRRADLIVEWLTSEEETYLLSIAQQVISELENQK